MIIYRKKGGEKRSLVRCAASVVMLYVEVTIVTRSVQVIREDNRLPHDALIFFDCWLPQVKCSPPVATAANAV